MRILVPLRLVPLVLAAAITFGASAPVMAQQANPAQESTAPKKARVVGTVKAINGNTLTLGTDSGAEISVAIAPGSRIVRMEPGQTDLKAAPPIQVSDIQVGDRLLAAGTPTADGKSFAATTAVIMKKSDVAEKQERDLEDWQRNGVNGVVKAVDPATGTITLATGALGNSTMLVEVSKQTIIRRYSPDSTKFEDARPGTLEQVKAGDQLRARGTRSEDGKQLAATEIVSGTFRSIPAALVSVDAANDTITVNDLATKRVVTLKVGPDSQMHQLPAMFAQVIAMRLKGGGPAAGAGAGGQAMHRPGGEGGSGEGHGMRPGGPPDFQRMLNRMPPVTLKDLHKGDAMMIVATEGTAQTPSTVIILLSGVEPILAASSPQQASTILSPWNLSSGGNAGTGDAP